MKVSDSDRSWLALGITDPADMHREFPVPWSANTLQQLTLPEIRGVAIVNPRLRQAFEPSLPNLLRDFDLSVSTIVVLLPRAPLPKISASQGDPVFAFLCSAPVFRELRALSPAAPLSELCFSLLHSIMNRRLNVEKIFVRQLPYWGKIVLSHPSSEPVALVMAHRGSKSHLESALHFIHVAEGGPLRLRVGLDVDRPSEFGSVIAQYPQGEFYCSNPAPVGPYAIRQELVSRSSEQLIFLHDSDDISCSDRFTVLQAEMQYTDCHRMVGSHELMVDELKREVSPVRYPLDVSNALRKSAGFSFLHATAVIGRNGFLSAGGLSTDRVIAYDTQFLLRAYFKLRIANVDEFLYIRRRHGASLTVARETADGIPLRRQLGEMWRADFEAIKQGAMRLEESSLRPSLRPCDFQFIRLSPGAIALPHGRS